MKAWTEVETNTLLSLLVDGVSIRILCAALPGRTRDSILTRARKESLGLNFRTSSRDGKLYEGVTRRGRNNTSEARITIVGQPRTALTVQEPTTSVRTNQNFTDDSIANNPKNTYAGLKAYTDAVSILQSNNLPVEHDFACLFSSYILSSKIEDTNYT